MATEGKSPSLFAYLFAPGGNDKQKTNSCKALRSARCLASSQNNIKYVVFGSGNYRNAYPSNNHACHQEVSQVHSEGSNVKLMTRVVQRKRERSIGSEQQMRSNHERCMVEI